MSSKLHMLWLCSDDEDILLDISRHPCFEYGNGQIRQNIPPTSHEAFGPRTVQTSPVQSSPDVDGFTKIEKMWFIFLLPGML